MNLPATRFSYDQLHYIGKAYLQTHPDRLAALGRLHGMRPAPVDCCRVLELACGDGSNLIPLAYSLPGSAFEGVDLAAAPLAAGQRKAAAIGLTNLRLEACDLLEFPADAGQFDYVIAHGFYSWCPPPVRDKILAVCGAHLAPQGIAFVSFNAYPGYHAKDLQRQLMLYHLAHVTADSPTEQARHALGALDFVARSQPAANPYQTALTEARDLYAQEITGKGDAGLAWFHHDLLSTCNSPVYFHEFMQHADGHGLQYICDTFMRVQRHMEFPPETHRALQAMQSDIITQEQYIDFIINVPFRQALLCRSEVVLERSLGPHLMQGLGVAGNLRLKPDENVTDGSDPNPQATETYLSPHGEVTVQEQDSKDVLRKIAAAWPGPVSFEALRAQSTEPGTEKGLAEFLLGLYTGKFITFRTLARLSAIKPGERPEGSAVARLQAPAGPVVTNLDHDTVALEAPVRHLLGLLDGSRNRAELLDRMRAWITSGEAAEARRQAADVEPGQEKAPFLSLDKLEADLNMALQAMADLGLLVR